MAIYVIYFYKFIHSFHFVKNTLETSPLVLVQPILVHLEHLLRHPHTNRQSS